MRSIERPHLLAEAGNEGDLCILLKQLDQGGPDVSFDGVQPVVVILPRDQLLMIPALPHTPAQEAAPSSLDEISKNSQRLPGWKFSPAEDNNGCPEGGCKTAGNTTVCRPHT